MKCSVKFNGVTTDWFDVSMGLKQGCILSPQFFNLFINDLTSRINDLKCGVKFGDEKISILLYADDIVLLSSNEEDLQCMLDLLYEYCRSWKMLLNFNKSKIVHFRPKSFLQTAHEFHCGSESIEVVSQYKYLGLILTEFLEYNVTTKIVSQSAGRALGLLMSKDKAFGGMPFECYSKCYDALVQSVINYGAAIWGSSNFSSISAVQNRACRFFLGLGKYAPNPAAQGDMGWVLPEHRQWICVIRQFCRMINMEGTLLSKRIFTWSLTQSSSTCRTLPYRIRKFLIRIDMEYVLQAYEVNTRSILSNIDSNFVPLLHHEWKEKLLSSTAVAGERCGGNKLRTYKTFKHDFITEPYAKFRCGVAPIRIETGRYGANRVPPEARLCMQCSRIEDEFHVIMQCPLYDDVRSSCLNSIHVLCHEFNELTLEHQFIEIMSNPLYYRIASKFMYDILNKRRFLTYVIV